MLAREFASWRRAHASCAELRPRFELSSLEFYGVSDEGGAFLEQMAQLHHMSGRAIARTMGVSRTIADLEESERVEACHVAEAIGFRIREGVGV